jgi:urease accessory protein UreF
MKASAFLSALQLGDSALPIGRFSHSYGLEEILTQEATMTAEAVAALIESIVLEVEAPLTASPSPRLISRQPEHRSSRSSSFRHLSRRSRSR